MIDHGAEHPEHQDGLDDEPAASEVARQEEIPPVVLAIGRLAVRGQVALG